MCFFFLNLNFKSSPCDLFTVSAGPCSSAGNFAPADRSHHPATADCLSFRQQGPGQYTGWNTFRSFIRTRVLDIISRFSRSVFPEPLLKGHDALCCSSPPQLLQAAAAIEQTGQAAAAAQVQQVQQAAGAAAAAVPQAPQQPRAQRPPMMLQVDGAGDTSSEEEEDEEEEYDEDDDEEKEKDAGEDWQVEEVCADGGLGCKRVATFYRCLICLCLFCRSH